MKRVPRAVGWGALLGFLLVMAWLFRPAGEPERRVRAKSPGTGSSDAVAPSSLGSAERGSGTASKSGERPPRREGPRTVTTASGLQYTVLETGTGDRPGPSDRVEVHYVGTTLDGRRFDGTDESGKPQIFPLNGVIKGWGEGLQLMREGSKFRFVIPPELAYGARGAPGRIGPNETLVFEVELIGIEPPAKAR